MKKTALLLAASVLGASLNAATGIFGTYVGIDVNGGGNTFYYAQPNGDGTGGLGNFEGLSIGTLNPTLGDSLVLSGGEVLTFKGGFPDDILGADIFWRVNRTTAPTETGSFAEIDLNFTSNTPFNDAAGNAYGSGNNQKWANIASTPNILSGLAVGTIANPISYELEVYFTALSDTGTIFSSDFGNNYTATFTLVPEPSAFALLAGLVGLGFATLKRRRS